MDLPSLLSPCCGLPSSSWAVAGRLISRLRLAPPFNASCFALVTLAALASPNATQASPRARIAHEGGTGSDSGRLVLEWVASPDARYDLEASADLKSWVRVDGFPIEGDGSVSSFELPANAKSLYYKISENLGPFGPPAGMKLMRGYIASEEARVSLTFRLTNAQGQPIQLSDSATVALFENDKLVDPDETIINVKRNPEVEKYSLLLFDLSGSLFSKAGSFQKLRDAAQAYLEAVFADGSHYVDIGYFAGDVVTHQNTTDTYYIQRNYGYQNSLEACLSLLDQIANTIPNDLSTNLNGAIYEGHQLLETIRIASSDATLRNLVILTDGEDSSGVYTDQQVSQVIAEERIKENGTSFYLINVGAAPGSSVVEGFDFDGLYFADDTGSLGTPFASISSRMVEESKGLVRIEYESAKRAGEVKGYALIEDEGSELGHPFTFNAGNFKSAELRLWWHDYDDGRLTVEDATYLVDSGIPVRYSIGRLYQDLDHVLIATNRDGNLEPMESTVTRKDGFDADYPYLSVFTGDLSYHHEGDYYTRYDRLTLEIRRKDGRVLKRSEPVPFYIRETQRFGESASFFSPGIFRVQYASNLGSQIDHVGPSGRYVYGVDNHLRPTGRRDKNSRLEVSSLGRGLLRYDRKTLQVHTLLPISGGGTWEVLGFDEAERKILMQKHGPGLYDRTYHLFDIESGRLLTLPFRAETGSPEGVVAYGTPPGITADGSKIVYRTSSNPSSIVIHDLATSEEVRLNPEQIFAERRIPSQYELSFNGDASLLAFVTHKTSNPDLFHGIYLYNRLEESWTELPFAMEVEISELQLSADGRFLFYLARYQDTRIDTWTTYTVSTYTWLGRSGEGSDNDAFDKQVSFINDRFAEFYPARMAMNGRRSWTAMTRLLPSVSYGAYSRGLDWFYGSEGAPDGRFETISRRMYDDSEQLVSLAHVSGNLLNQLNGTMSADGKIAGLREYRGSGSYTYILMDGEYSEGR